MTPRAALLPNETYCTLCAGEGEVPSEERYVSSCANEPRSTGMVDCPANCASGVVLHESRDASTRPGGEIAREFTALRNALAIEHAQAEQLRDALAIAREALATSDITLVDLRSAVAEQRKTIDTLRDANRRYRDAIDKAARVIVARGGRTG